MTSSGLPRLYVIVDDALLQKRGRDLRQFSAEVSSAGAELIQYRNKSTNAAGLLRGAAELKNACSDKARLIMNDRADLCLAAGFDGVHLGQDDLSPKAVRKVIGDQLWLGVSTHNPE